MSDSALVEQQDPQSEIIPRSGGFEITPNDIDIPRLNVVQAVSQIEAPHGSLVIDKRHILAELDQPITCIPLVAIKGFREDKPFGVEPPARSVYNENDLAALKKDTEYPIVEFANISLMFPEPEEAEGAGAFPFEIDGAKYSIGRLNVAKMAYAQTFKRLATYGQVQKGAAAYSVFWEITPITIEGRVTYYAPSLSVKDTEDKVSDEVVAWIDQFNQG